MRSVLAAVVALSFLLPAHAEPPKQQLRPGDEVQEPDPTQPKPLQGATVLVSGLITDHATEAAQPAKVIRLPVEAGRVSKIVTTNLVTQIPSWIVKGDKYYSLCMPNRGKVACAPIIATATMKDIEVNAYADAEDKPKLNFTIAKGTTQDAKRLIASINYFMHRVSIQAAHFNRKASTYAPVKAKAPGKPVRNVEAPMTIDSTMGSECTSDYFGGMDCTGGDSGNDGGGYSAETYDWGENYFADEESWPSLPALPTFPSASNNGDADPCVDASGNNVCQQVIITGERPEAPVLALQNCVVSPFGTACTTREPPAIVRDPTDDIPKGPQPWLPQGACNTWHALCSEGQVPEEDPPPLTEAEKRAKAEQRCVDNANAQMTACYSLRFLAGETYFHNCKREALQTFKECSLIGMDR